MTGRRSYITESFVKADGCVWDGNAAEQHKKHVGTAFVTAVMRESFGLSTVAGALLTLTGSCVLFSLGSKEKAIAGLHRSKRHYPSFVGIVLTTSRLKRRRFRPLITRTRLHDKESKPKRDIESAMTGKTTERV
jgi:hypothetical protein